MLYKLKELVFGLEEFEKARFDVRFELMIALLPSLRVEKLEDFEILEECISKLKELLRIKSSNLNKCIADSSKNLKKKDAVVLIEKLNEIKYDFLKRAFHLVETHEIDRVNEIIDTEDVMQKEGITEKDFNSLIFENDEYRVTLENGKVPYILISFSSELDYSIVNSYATLLFEEYGAQGTNVIVQDEKVLIVPRFERDNLINLPRVELDLDEVYEKLKSDDKVDEKEAPKVEEFNEKKKEKDTSNSKISDNDEYLEVRKKPFEKRRDSSGLDDLLMDDYKEGIVHPNPREDSSKIDIIKDDNIIIEMKEPEIEDSGVEIIRKKNHLENSEEKISKDIVNEVEKELKAVEKKENDKESILEKQDVKDNLEVSDQSKISSDNLEEHLKSFEHELYRDDKIVIYFREDSQVLGELILRSVSDKNFNDLSEGDLSYIMMFSKAFSAYLFEILEAHGTNIIFDYNDSLIRIVPRYQEDGLTLRWDPLALTEADFESVKEKLIHDMMNVLDSSEKKEEEKPMEVIENVSGEVVDPEKKEEEDAESERAKKAKYILDSIHRIP